jgi:hypothetical protein
MLYSEFADVAVTVVKLQTILQNETEGLFFNVCVYTYIKFFS